MFARSTSLPAGGQAIRVEARIAEVKEVDKVGIFGYSSHSIESSIETTREVTMFFICFLCMLAYQSFACFLQEKQGTVFTSRLVIVLLYAMIGPLVRNVMPTLWLCMIAVCSTALYAFIVWRLMEIRRALIPLSLLLLLLGGCGNGKEWSDPQPEDKQFVGIVSQHHTKGWVDGGGMSGSTCSFVVTSGQQTLVFSEDSNSLFDARSYKICSAILDNTTIPIVERETKFYWRSGNDLISFD